MKIPKWLIGLFLMILILGIAMPFFVFHRHFGNSLSNDQTQWGTYGDFIGGMLNPFFALINVGVLILLSWTIHENEQKREEANHEFERKLIMSQMKQDALKEFVILKRDFVVSVNQKEDILSAVLVVQFGLEGLFRQYEHFFRCIKENKERWEVKQAIDSTNVLLDPSAVYRNDSVGNQGFKGLVDLLAECCDEIQTEIRIDWETRRN